MQTRRILIFNVNWLGDVLFSTAAIRNIRYNYPDSYIACVVPLGCEPILSGNPHLNEIIVFDERDTHRGFLAKIKFIGLLKNKKFDTVFLLHRSFSRALICYLAGIPERVGYFTSKRSFLLTKKITPPNPDRMHRIDYYLNLIEKAGLKVKDRFSEFFIRDEDLKFVDNFLDKESIERNRLLVGINPGGNWPPKRWSKEYWAELADRLIRELRGQVIITGSLSDMRLAQDIQSLMKEKLISACGKFNLKQLGALCKRLNLFISADTGPLHLANSVDTQKIIALFGPTCVSITGPYPADNVSVIVSKDVSCKIPCYEADCRDNRCMRAITVEEVLKQIKLLRVTNAK